MKELFKDELKLAESARDNMIVSCCNRVIFYEWNKPFIQESGLGLGIVGRVDNQGWGWESWVGLGIRVWVTD